jgi:hypothetical protein
MAHEHGIGILVATHDAIVTEAVDRLLLIYGSIGSAWLRAGVDR